MDLEDFWQNFELGIELETAGTFVYNGLRSFHEMDTLHNEDEIFDVLYQLSVGIERLLKVAVVLLEYEKGADQKAFEQTLITHNHQNLLDRIKLRATGLTRICTPHNSFLQLLTKFYKTYRYDRFQASSSAQRSKDKQELLSFLSKQLKIDLTDDGPLQIARNDEKLRSFLGKIVGTICKTIYGIAESAARKKNLYTYEIRYNSKAAKIFLKEEYDFRNEDIFWREVILDVFASSVDTAFGRLLKTIGPLELDSAFLPERLEGLRSYTKRIEVMDEILSRYDDLTKSERKKRLELLELIGQKGEYIFDEEGEEDWEDEEESQKSESK